MGKQIKGLLLAAGEGTRLRPLTLETPKCLVKVGGEVVLEKWLQKLEAIGSEACIVNTHYLAEKVESYIQKREDSNMEIQVVREEMLLGTAGTLIRNQYYLNDGIIIMAHVDNATNIGLENLVNKYLKREKDILLTMLTFNTKNPKECGIVGIDSEGRVNSYKEKSSDSTRNVANGAVFVFGNELIEWINQNTPNAKDFCADIIPKLIGKMNTWHTDEVYIDIGTREKLEEANKILGGY